jgi:hypothetical protein
MNPDQRLPAILSLVMIMATATLGWMSLRSGGLAPFGEYQMAAQVPADRQYIVARLWEDPLQAIQAEVAKNKDKDAHPALAGLRKAVEEISAKCPVSFLVVPIPETPYPGDLEARLRTRYSIQMALADKNYAPKNRNYLGYFKLPQPEVPANEAEKVESVYVPYEWFAQRPNPAKKGAACSTLVLWLPESHLNRNPLGRLAKLCDDLIGQNTSNFSGVFMIGPRSSDTLKSLIPTDSAMELLSLQNKLSIFSPQATAPDELINLQRRPVAREDFSERIQTAFGSQPKTRDSWQYFHNFIATDDQLTDLLVSELHLRGVNLGGSNSQDKILILAEADTSYGRVLPYAFTQSLERHRHSRPEKSSNPTASAATAANSDQLDPQLFIYRYLRGLDQQKGQQNTEKSNNRPTAKSPEEVLADVLSKKGAPALGESQLDYVDRIAADLEHWEKDPKTGSVRAVGVLGGDVYDKLILLRTLRVKYPDAIFFTTDLDARLWHPDHLAYTRNLIVASGYGVDARPVSSVAAEPRLRIPPFRDVYQVAVFHACRAALAKIEDPRTSITPDLTPSVFELGRNGPAKLVPGTPPKGVAATLGSAVLNFGVPKLSAGQVRGIVLAVIGLIGAWYALRKWFVKAVDPRPFFTVKHRYIGCFLVGSVVLLIWAYSAMQYIAAQPGSEPWIAHEGISIWPTEMMRIFVIVAVIFIVVWSLNHRDRVRAQVGSTYFPGTSHDSQRGATLRDDSSGLDPNSALAAYNKYLKVASWRRRFIRVTWLSVAYMLLGFGAAFLLEGEIPFLGHIRGPAAQRIDFLIMSVSIFAYIWLLFYVLDSAWITSRLLLVLSQRETIWPSTLVAKMREQFGVEESDLAGYLDVQFAAEKSREVGRLIIFPFVIQLLFIISRSSYFDHWTWPGVLIGIFLCNVFLAWAAWAILRRSARKIRKDAEKKIQGEIDQLKLGLAPTAEAEADLPSNRRSENNGAAHARLRLRRLFFLRKKVELEQRGAYSKAFQDPALIATILPTGIFGILAVLFRAFFA